MISFGGFLAECLPCSDRIVDMNLIKMEIGGCLLQMQGHSFTLVGISATHREMIEVINS